MKRRLGKLSRGILYAPLTVVILSIGLIADLCAYDSVGDACELMMLDLICRIRGEGPR